MAKKRPEPEASRPGSKGSAGDPARPPRILVEVGDLEDPAEWDVILVENQDIDDDTARAIAAQRAGRPAGPRLGPRIPAGPTVSLPSLDERDVIQAFETDRQAEDADEIDDDAFARPDDATPVRRRGQIELPPESDAFADHPEPGDEPEPEAVEPEPAPEPEAPEPVAEPEPVEEVDPWVPAVREGPVLLDDPDDPFYAVGADTPDAERDDAATEAGDDAPDTGDEAVAPEATDDEADREGDDQADDEVAARGETAGDAEGDGPGDTDATPPGEADATDGDPAAEEPSAAEPSEWDLTAVALDEDRDLLDDPDDPFYAVGRARIAAFRPTGPVVTPAVALPAPTDRLGSELWGAPATPADEVFEEELEIDSSFPLGPEDLAADPDATPPPLHELDYANVFGPVTGSLSIPDLDVPPDQQRQRRGVAYEDELYVFEDDERHWPVPPPKTMGRRRELVALGIAAGVIVVLGVGSQVLARPDHQNANPTTSTTSTTRVRARTTDTTAPDLTLPTLPPEDGPDDPSLSPVTTVKKPRVTTTTVKKGATTTTAAPNTTTTAAPTTTSTVPETTTTTAPPETTTTAP